MDLSIIIVNYRTPQLTENCIKSVHAALRNKSISYEIILVDNHSDDGNINKLQKLKDERTYIFETEKNGGFGYGNNRGVEKSTGEYLFFLNSDTVLYPDVLLRMLFYLRENRNIGIMGCLMHDSENNPLVSAHQFENMKSLFVQTIIKPLVPKAIMKRRGISFASTNTDATECDWVSGAAMLMPRSIFDLVNGWNEAYFLYMEDEELCYRVHKAGYEVMLFPEFGLQHLISKSGGSAFSAYQRYKSKMMFYYETDPTHYLINRRLLLIQAKQYMKNLSKEERNDVISRLKEIQYE